LISCTVPKLPNSRFLICDKWSTLKMIMLHAANAKNL
jgi:hypothetical protein